MRRPTPRGPLSAALLQALAGAPGPVPPVLEAARRAVDVATDVLADDDVQLSLLVLYQLHYGGLEGVDDAWEWQPDLLRVRAELEAPVEAAVHAVVPAATTTARTAAEVAQALFDLTAADDGPSVSTYVARRATDEQVRELVVHRSVYHLKEADPHAWALPRLSGRAKSALIEIQADEYGGGRPGAVHSELFAAMMRTLGMDDTEGAYLDLVPARTIASMNVLSMFGLHRRLRGALVGHLTAFEMTSSIPCRRYSAGLRRLGYGEDVTHYFDEHVEADAVHEQVAAHDLAGGLAESEPALVADILWGAAVYLVVDGGAGASMLQQWESGRTSLRTPTSLAA